MLPLFQKSFKLGGKKHLDISPSFSSQLRSTLKAFVRHLETVLRFYCWLTQVRVYSKTKVALFAAASGVGGLPWWRRPHRCVWRSAERPAAGHGAREPHCRQGAAGSHRQHPGTVLCRGPLRPERLRQARRQDRHLEGGVETQSRGEKREKELR